MYYSKPPAMGLKNSKKSIKLDTRSPGSMKFFRLQNFFYRYPGTSQPFTLLPTAQFFVYLLYIDLSPCLEGHLDPELIQVTFDIHI